MPQFGIFPSPCPTHLPRQSISSRFSASPLSLQSTGATTSLPLPLVSVQFPSLLLVHSAVAGRCPSGSSISSFICLIGYIDTYSHTHTHIQTYSPISKPTAITQLAENCDHPYLPICPPPSVSLLLHSSASTPRSNRDWKCPASSPSSLRQIQSRPHMPIP